MSWSGKGLTQNELMLKDECILVDNDDNVIGHASKQDAHIFNKSNPRGMLHRAFSVFLFDNDGNLLLQKRASSKITFPNVWTNTCCSHPLYGYQPNEVDNEKEVLKGNVNGVKAAAIRKLEHELGIPAKQVPITSFKYLTRLHYWAADVVTHGKKSKWGEHEIDYILFIQLDKKKLTIKPNPEEVGDIKFVSLNELQKMMNPKTGLLWSPWFRIIADQFLVHWWNNLNATMTTDLYVDYKTIHRFDPTEEHMGGGGNAGSWLGTASSPYGNSKASKVTKDTGLKQGGYGKVKIHKHSKIDQLMRIDEVFAVAWLMTGAKLPNKVKIINEDFKFCDDMLGKVSRSFAAVIRQLPKGLCIDILIFYLALRALDTIEDDMEAFKGKEHIKIDHLNNFYRTGLVTDGWSMDGVGEGDEKTLLQEYFRCVNVFKSLSTASQEVIADITKRMGQGMASYVAKDLGQGTVTVDDYNLYCHYVAGLVGEGLSRLFTCCGYETEEVANVSKTLANTMGLFLQKTNIIRDYLEDYVDGRTFWPQEIWKKYTKSNDLGELAKEENRTKAVQCLNHLITDALELVPECMEYMNLLQTEEVFRFCAIPQVMAIATLSDLYNNPLVFTGVVKIRKGLAAKLLLDTKSFGGLHKWFNVFAYSILQRVNETDPSADRTRTICNKIISLTESNAKVAIAGSYCQVVASLAPIIMIFSSYYLFKDGSKLNSTFPYLKFLKSGSNSALKQKPEVETILPFFFFLLSTLNLFGYTLVAAGRKSLRRADK